MTEIEESEDSLLTGSAMTLRVIKRDMPAWYSKNDGKLLPMLNRGRQIARIVKRDGQLSAISLDKGQVTIFPMDGQFARILKR